MRGEKKDQFYDNSNLLGTKIHGLLANIDGLFYDNSNLLGTKIFHLAKY